MECSHPRKSIQIRYKTMIFPSALIVFLLVECCPANKRVGPHYETTSSPRGVGGKSTHISEFTDPATGLNPFLDLEEGLTGEMGRNVVEEEVLPRPLSDSDLQLVEGGPDDRVSPRWNEGLVRRWENFNKPRRVIPISSASHDETSTEKQSGKRRYDDQFSTATETSFLVPPDILMPSTEDSDSDEQPDYHSLRPVGDRSLDTDYETEYHSVEEETAVVQEDSSHPKKVPVSKNILISAAITGASVAVIALLLAICWWRQKMKRVSTRGSTNVTDNNIESIISDKANTNSDIQKKSISA